MKMSSIYVGVLASVLGFAAVAKENSVIVLADDAKRGGGKAVSVDFQAEEAVSAFQLRLTLPADAQKVNTAGCLADLPKSHTGMCKAVGNRVAIVVYSMSGAEISPGLVSVGKITYVTREGGAVAVDKMVSSGRDAQNDAVNGRVEAIN